MLSSSTEENTADLPESVDLASCVKGICGGRFMFDGDSGDIL